MLKQLRFTNFKAEALVDFAPMAGVFGGAPFSERRTVVQGRTVLLVLAAAGLVAGFVAGEAGGGRAAAQAGPELVRLLRAMAVLKFCAGLAVTASIVWRLQAPVAVPRLLAYSLACCATAAGPGLIWGMTHLLAGAVLLHAGLLGAGLMLWRDPAAHRLLADKVARRRRLAAVAAARKAA
jgi:hypothetical protein